MIRPNLRLILAIKQRGLKQRDLCKLLGIFEPVLSEMINGKRVVDTQLKLRIAQVLDIPVNEIFPEEATERRSNIEPQLQLNYECRSLNKRYSEK